MRAIITALALTLGLCAGACSSVYDTEVPTDINDEAAMKAFRDKIAELPEDERVNVTAYMMRMKLGEALGGIFGAPKTDGIPPGTTVRKALDEQKTFSEERKKAQAIEQAQTEVEKAKEEAERVELDAKVKMLADMCSATVLKKEFQPSDFRAGRIEDKILLAVKFSNNSQKELAGVKGTIEFYDMFGELVKGVNISFDDGLKPGEWKVWEGAMGYNQFFESDKKLASIELEKLKVKWVPQMFVLADGTKVE